MTPIRRQLLDLCSAPDHYERDAREIAELQLVAAQELFEERIEQLPLLKRRADDGAITRIGKLDDLLPLLLPHTAYKSYPPSFIEQGRWDRMLQWLQTLSVENVRDTDIRDVQGVDDWVERLWAAGHQVMATSGTSGKCSFLNRSVRDREQLREYFKVVMGGFLGLTPKQDRPVFQLFPKGGPNYGVQASLMNAELWGRPGEVVFLSDEPLKVSEVSRAATLRKRMKEGLATPTEIANFEAETAAKNLQSQAKLRQMVEKILAHRHEPIFLSGMWAQHWIIMQTARAMGIGDGEFHPDSLVAAGGGLKGIMLPDDYEQQINRFYGNVKRPKNYGMTEMALMLPRCEAQRYHVPAGLIPLVVNANADELLGRIDGIVEGRFAFVDLLFEGRWGGVIGGDRVRIDFAPTCACGRRGPVLLEPITRFAAPGEDDHIGCAGTIDAYLRGAVEA